MKRYALIIICICLSFLSNAQDSDTYTVDGTSYQLKTEVSGTIDLLWNSIDKEYRYFVKKGDTIIELLNTKGNTNTYQEEYKETLQQLTSDVDLPVKNLKFTLHSLKNFVNTYNKAKNPDYSFEEKTFKLKTRVGILGGMTNLPFVENPNNEVLSMFFGEIAFFDAVSLKRHEAFFRVKHIPEEEAFKYTATQLGLGYRFKFINSEVFRLYTNVTFATVNFAKTSFTYTDETMATITEDERSTNFDMPFIFGLGLDVKLTNGLYATLDYDELFAIFFENQGNFSRHLAFGVKFNL